jgi:hypothetical protein
MYRIKTISKKMSLFFLAMLLILALSACYSDYGMSTKDYDVVATLYDSNFDFTKVKTYTMPDTIIHIVEEGEESNLSRKYDSFILKEVALQMEYRQIQRIPAAEVDPNNPPDVVIALRATSSDYYQAYYSYYWGYPIYGWGWGGYYPWYGGTTVYSYSTGTIFIDMIDVEEIDMPNEEYPTVWFASINGLLGDTSTGTQQRLSSSIDQAFLQSPYIGVIE